MPALDQATASFIKRTILRWYRQHRRDFPWRKTRDPYRILVSEIMLQQTQALRVSLKYPQFLRRFPTLRALASAPRARVVRAWQGMGYNNRAVRLHELAQIVLRKYGGNIPPSAELLRDLPGIGPYTSHAVACFAFDRRVAVVDTNVRRLFSRIFWRARRLDDVRSDREIQQLADRLLPRDAYTWNQAVMEFGALVCTPRAPACAVCPIAVECRSRGVGSARTNGRRVRDVRREPTHSGIPRRIWRGRIVEALRNADGRSPFTLLQLGAAAKLDFTSAELPWLADVVGALTRDGLVETVYARGTVRVRLAEE